MNKRIIHLIVISTIVGVAKLSNGAINCANAPNVVTVSGPKYVEVNKSATYTCTVGTTGGTYAWTYPGFSITSGQGTDTLVVQALGTPSASKGDKQVKCVYTRTEGACNGYVDATIVKLKSQTVATAPTDRARKKLGVGEKVTMTLEPTSLTPLTWSKTGQGTLSATTGNNVTFTAHDRASTPTVKVTYDSNDYTISFNVIEPSGGLIEQEPGTGVWHIQGVPTCGFKGRPYIQPDDVSFQNIYIREGSVNAVTTGYFSYQGSPNHTAGTTPVSVGSVTTGKGSKVNAVDTIQGGSDNHTPYVNGTFTWAIPWYFKVGTGAEKQFATINHVKSIDSTGTLSISKGGTTTSAALNATSSSY